MLIQDLSTPSLLLDLDRLERNCARMSQRACDLGVRLRPHLKTAKSADVARLATGSDSGGITVSTIEEIAYFTGAGFKDFTYAVGIVPQKIPPLADLARRHGATISLVTDSEGAISAVGEQARREGQGFPIFIEIDCGGGRGGVTADSAELVSIARAIGAQRYLTLAGVLTHAGQSYACPGREHIACVAETERAAAVQAAQALRAAGIEVYVVSVGSTPTAVFADSLEGVDEVRPGVYMLCDLDQVVLGVCDVSDIAASVLTTVIGHNVRSARMLIDAGALALSKDLSAFHFDESYGYGIVCTELGEPVAGMHVSDLHQEHGFVTSSSRQIEELQDEFPIGTRLRVLPNHACMTVAPYTHYNLVRGCGKQVLGQWQKAAGGR